MVAKLRTSGLKITHQRLAVVRELAEDVSHPTAQELFDRLKKSLPTMSFATVYNTLDVLATAGLARRLTLHPGPMRFDPTVVEHDHFVCNRCGVVRDVNCGERNATGGGGVPTTLEGDEMTVQTVERIFRGFCANCRPRS